VLDTNVLISAALSSKGAPHALVQHILGQSCLVFSNATFEELRSRLYRPKFDVYLSLEVREGLLHDFSASAQWVEPDNILPFSRDPSDDVFIATAAVADWRPAQAATQKIKKDGSGHMPAMQWIENPDILAEAAASERARKGDLYCIGFAAESHDLLAHAQAKLARKKVPLIVGNIGADTFGADDNALLLVDANGAAEWPRAPKTDLAQRLVAEIAKRIQRS
jgi:phosphopantothenoylcysteine decarboxylase/phosphopantothenate--cysteine ligase